MCVVIKHHMIGIEPRTEQPEAPSSLHSAHMHTSLHHHLGSNDASSPPPPLVRRILIWRLSKVLILTLPQHGDGGKQKHTSYV